MKTPTLGSSPRARGTLLKFGETTSHNRFIPACAGNTNEIPKPTPIYPISPLLRSTFCHNHNIMTVVPPPFRAGSTCAMRRLAPPRLNVAADASSQRPTGGRDSRKPTDATVAAPAKRSPDGKGGDLNHHFIGSFGTLSR